MSNLFEQALADFYLGIPKRESTRIDELKSSDIFNIDNSSMTDSDGKYRQVQITMTDPSVAPTTGTNKAEFIVPFDGSLVGARLRLSTAGSTITQCSLKNSSGEDVLIGYLQLTANNTVSESSTIDVTKKYFYRSDPIKVDINLVGTNAKGMIITLYFTVDTFYSN